MHKVILGEQQQGEKMDPHWVLISGRVNLVSVGVVVGTLELRVELQLLKLKLSFYQNVVSLLHIFCWPTSDSPNLKIAYT